MKHCVMRLKALLLLLIVTLIGGCKSTNVPVIKYSERIVKVKDTAAVAALFECDSNYNVLLRELRMKATPNMLVKPSFDSSVFILNIVNMRDSIVYNYRDSVIFVPSGNKLCGRKNNYLTIIVITILLAWIILKKLV